MRVLYLPLMIILFVCFVFTGNAQTESNVKSKFSDVIFSESAKQKQIEFDKMTADRVSTKVMSLGSETVYTIPVVVHIIHNNGTENITNAQVQTAIQRLNDAYSNSNVFANGQGVNVNIQFCLATQNPDKLPSSGINRVVDLFTDLNVPSQDAALKALSYWPSDRYLNIWIVKEITGDGDPSVAGYATMPSDHGKTADGVVVEARYFAGSVDDIKIAIHEIGHYLGLYHTFQAFDEVCENSNCLLDGDKVCDTPPEGTDGVLPVCTAFRNSCSSDEMDTDPRNPFRAKSLGGIGDQHDLGNNYMNYNKEACQISFTQGQKERMRDQFLHYRSSLITSTGCQPGCTSVINLDFSFGSSYYVGQPANINNASSNATAYQWAVDGVNYSTAVNFSKIFSAEGTYVISLTGTNANPACTQTLAGPMIVTCPVVSSVSASQKKITVGQSVTFTATGSSIYQWAINGVAIPNSPNQSLTYTFSTAGIYQVSILASNGFCNKMSPAVNIEVGMCGFSKATNVWYFGLNAGLDFNSGSPQAIFNGSLISFESASAICDENGQILFYSDGRSVYDKNGTYTTPNGYNSLLGGTGSASQGVLITPFPGSSTKYYIFTNDELENGCAKGFNYSVFDMSLNNGLGDVDPAVKNINLFKPGSERIGGTMHQNNNDIWILTNVPETNKINAYRITNTGINAPVVSTAGSVYSNGNGTGTGTIKFSNSGSKVVVTQCANTAQTFFEIFNFNNSTGILSNPIKIFMAANEYPYGVEFSPDMSKIFITSPYHIFQYDLNAGSAAAISASRQTIFEATIYNTLHGIQLGPDNKIYVVNDESNYLGVINNPNNYGVACNYEPMGIYLGQDPNSFINNNKARINFPTLLNQPLNSNAININGPHNVCVTSANNIIYKAESLNTPSSYFWDIVSGSATITGSNSNQQISLNFNGAGTVQLRCTTTSSCGKTTSILKIIAWGVPPAGFLGPDVFKCTGNVSLSAQNKGFTSYLWSMNNIPDPYISVNTPGKYSVTVTNAGGCVGSDEVEVFQAVYASDIDLGPDIVSCAKAVIILDAGANYKTYLWGDGSTEQKLTVYKPGIYTILVTDHCGNTAYDYIIVSNTSAPSTTAIAGPSLVCSAASGITYSVAATVGSSYVWTVPPAATYTSNIAGNQITVSFNGFGGDVTVTETIISSGCKGATMVLPITVSNASIEITTGNNNTEPTVLIPTCHPSMTLNATAGFVSYQWKKNGNNVLGATNSTLILTQGTGQYGDYTVTGVDANGCLVASSRVTVIDALTITGDDKICPGDKASLEVNIAGVVGDYFVQWFQNGSTISTTAPSGTAGLYSAIVVLPAFEACTLTTAPKLVDLLLSPAPYTVSPGGPVYICSSDAPVTLAGAAPAVTPVAISSYSWNTGVATPTISTNVPGYYNITAQGVNGCSSISNSVLVLAPTITVTQHCNSDGSTKLTANQNINGSNYVWKNSAGATVGTTQSINVTQNDTYTVTSNDTRCNAAATALVCTPSSTNLGTNLVANGDFNISTTASPVCLNYTVNSDLTCSDATTTPLNAGNWPSNFKITSNAGAENQNKWQGTGFVKTTDPTDIYCLIADGRVIDQKQRVWYQQVAVENCATYTFSIFVKNIIINEAEIPKVSLKIGNYTIKSKTLYANQPNWIELSGTWRSNVTGNVEISVLLDGGGWVGRDIAIDEIYFAKTNCMKATPVGRICNAVAEVGVDRFICAGQNVQIGDNQNIAGLTYSWTGPGGYISTVSNPTVNPITSGIYTLTVTDNANNCSATDYVAVNVILPAVTITKDITATCSATQVKASLFNGVPNVQYEWLVNGNPSVTNATGVFSLTGIANGAIIKCRLVTACASNIYSNEITVGTSAPVTATQTTICSGQSTQLHANMSGGTAPFTYTWTASTGAAPSAVAEPIVSPTTPTTYSLTFKDANNCTFIGSVTVVVNALPPAVSVSPTTACVGTQVWVTASQGAGNQLISLTDPSFMNRTNGTGGNGYVSYLENITAAGTGNFVAVSRSTMGCERTTVVPFTAYAAPVPMTVAISKNPACIGDQINVSVNYGVGNTLTNFTDPSTISRIGGGGGPGTISFSANVISAGAGNFVGVATNAQGCTTTTTVPFTVVSPPAMTIVPSSNPVCVGSTFTVTVNYGTGSGYSVTSQTDPSIISRLGGTGFQGGYAFGATAVTVGTGNFVGVVTSTEGCTTTTTVPFTVAALPTPQTVTITPNPACEGGAVTVSVTYSTGNTGTLTRPSMVGTSTNGGGGQYGYGYTAPVTAAGTGNFVSTTTSPQGCSTVVNIPFTALPRPAVPAITSTGTLICSGSPILLSTTATATGYQWYNGANPVVGATNSTYSATAVGTYTMRVSDANACWNTSAGIALTTSTLAAPRVHVDDATDNYCASAPVAMKVGTAVQLNGTTQYVNVPGFNFPASGSAYGGPITIEFWVNTTGTYGSGFSVGGLNTTGNRAQAHVPGSDGNLYWDYGNYSGNGRISAPFANFIGRWTHVAFVSAGNGGNFKGIYINGVLASSSTVSDGPDVQLTGLTIGKWMTYYTGGMMDEFRVWNKVLSAAEVQAAMTTLYESGTPNLMGSWGFDEASGTTVNNDAFSAQTGTLMNSAARVYPTTGLTYTWSPAANLNTSTGTTVIPNTSVVRTYTVKGVDANGCSAYAQVVATPNTACKDGANAAIAEAITGWDVDVYPNPTEDNVHISFKNITKDTDLSLEVVGMDGAVIFTIDHVGMEEVVNLHELPSGLYLIRVKNGEEVKTKKVVVVK